MIIRLDAHLKPELADWITATFKMPAVSLRRLQLHAAKDLDVYQAARRSPDGVVLMTKDQDFVELVTRLGPPPQVIWLTIGNTKTRVLKDVLSKSFTVAIEKLDQGASLVEVSLA